MRFLVSTQLSPGDFAPQLDRVRSAIERDDFKAASLKKLQVGGYDRAQRRGAP